MALGTLNVSGILIHYETLDKCFVSRNGAYLSHSILLSMNGEGVFNP